MASTTTLRQVPREQVGDPVIRIAEMTGEAMVLFDEVHELRVRETGDATHLVHDFDRALPVVAGDLDSALTGLDASSEPLAPDVARLRAAWDAVGAAWERTKGSLSHDPGTHPAGLGDLESALRKVVVTGLGLCLPEQVNARLHRMRTGTFLRYGEEFGNTVPPDLLPAGLEVLRRRTADLEGILVVEGADARIYAINSRGWFRLLTRLSPLLVAVLGYLLVWVAGLDQVGLLAAIDPGLTWNGAAVALTLGYAGAVLHLWVTYQKEANLSAETQDGGGILGRWMLWLHVKYLEYSVSVLGVILATGLALWSLHDEPAAGSSAWLLLITAGYFSDSIADTFLGKVPSKLAPPPTP